jgi:hypothetical protein
MLRRSMALNKYIARLVFIWFWSLERSSTNFGMFGLFRKYCFIYLILKSLYNSKRKSNSSSSVLHKIQMRSFLGIRCGLRHLPVSIYNLCDDRRNLVKAAQYLLILTCSMYFEKPKVAKILYVSALGDASTSDIQV